jgi:hypothetical protein
MKIFQYLSLFMLLLLFSACQKEEELLQEPAILSVSVGSTVSMSSPQPIEVRIQKPTPCHQVARVNATTSGTTYSYDIILENGAQICAQVIEEEVVTVSFSPQGPGLHTLNFLINGRLLETRQVVVEE